MTFWTLDPEVPGQLAPGTVLDRGSHPPLLAEFHLVVAGWLGSDLVACFPAFAVTTRLADALREGRFSGYELAEMQVSLDEQYADLHPEARPPDLIWLKVTGTAFEDDFGLDSSLDLVVSDRVVALLRTMRLVECEVEEAARPT